MNILLQGLLHYFLFDLNGEYVDAIRCGTCSHEALSDSFSGTKRVMKEHLDVLFKRNNITVENIVATEEDIDAKIAEQAASVGKSVEEYKTQVNEKQVSYIENGVIIDKLFKFLKENNEIGGEAKPAKKTTKKATAKKEDAEVSEEPVKKTRKACAKKTDDSAEKPAKKTTTKKSTKAKTE